MSSTSDSNFPFSDISCETKAFFCVFAFCRLFVADFKFSSHNVCAVFNAVFDCSIASWLFAIHCSICVFCCQYCSLAEFNAFFAL